MFLWFVVTRVTGKLTNVTDDIQQFEYKNKNVLIFPALLLTWIIHRYVLATCSLIIFSNGVFVDNVQVDFKEI